MRYSLCLLVIALAACRPSEPVAAPAEPPRSVQDPAPVAYASEKQAFVVAEQVVGPGLTIKALLPDFTASARP